MLNKEAKDLLLCAIYRPPSGNVATFCDVLTSTLDEIGNDFNKEIFIMGDFNINYHDKNNSDTQLLLQMELNTGLKQLINMPTRDTNTIDLIYSNAQDIANSGVLELNISDHDLIIVTKKKGNNKRKQVCFTGRSYRNYDKKRFKII